MEFEEEFGIEIPDKDAEKMFSNEYKVQELIEYIVQKQENKI